MNSNLRVIVSFPIALADKIEPKLTVQQGYEVTTSRDAESLHVETIMFDISEPLVLAMAGHVLGNIENTLEETPHSFTMSAQLLDVAGNPC